VCECSLSFLASKVDVPYYIIFCGLSGFHIFPRYLITGMILGKEFTEHEMPVLTSLQHVSETLLIIRRLGKR
jgi:hypothetical protein